MRHHQPALVAVAGGCAAALIVCASLHSPAPPVERIARPSQGIPEHTPPVTLIPTPARPSTTLEPTVMAPRSAPSVRSSLAPSAIKAIVDHLDHPDHDVRAAAAAALAQVGPDAASAVPALVRALHESTPREAFAFALGRMGPAAVLPLFDVLRGHDPALRRLAAESLAIIGPASVDALVDALIDMRPEVRRLAAACLERIGPDAAPAAIAPLRWAAADDDLSVRRIAVAALGVIGADDPVAMDALVGCCADTNEEVRIVAARGLGRPSALPRLAVLLRTGDEAERLAAVAAIGRIGPPAGDLVADLQRLVTLSNGKDHAMVAAACWALDEIGAESP